MNIRASYSKTLNRPEFRELAPFLFFDFNTGFSLNGDPKLQRATIHNYDLRWELFPMGGQLVSVSGFRKEFTNSIELVKAQNTYQVEYKNAQSAFAQGVELEYRVNIGNFYKNDTNVIGKLLNNITLFSNLSLIQSQVTKGNFGNAASTYARPMQGQSSYVINGGLTYQDNVNNFSFSTMVNRVGPRLYLVGNNIYEEVWEMPRTVLDVQLTKSFLNNRLELRLNIKDILAQDLVFVQNYAPKPVNEKSTDVTEFWKQSFGSVYSFQIGFKF